MGKTQKVILEIPKGKKSRWYIWLLLGLVLGAGGMLTLTLSFGGDGTTPLPPDTLTLMKLDTLETVDIIYLSEGEGGSGTADPTVDTFYFAPSFSFIPNWRIHEIDYRRDCLKLTALKLIGDGDPETEILSRTYYTPSGFHIKVVGDSIRVDTFTITQSSEPIIQKEKSFRWKAGLGYGITGKDSVLKHNPVLSLGCEWDILKIKRVQATWEIGEFDWTIGDYPRLKTELVIKF